MYEGTSCLIGLPTVYQPKKRPFFTITIMIFMGGEDTLIYTWPTVSIVLWHKPYYRPICHAYLGNIFKNTKEKGHRPSKPLMDILSLQADRPRSTFNSFSLFFSYGRNGTNLELVR